MTDIEEPPALKEFRRSLFGDGAPGETMPPAYVLQLRRLTNSAEAILGIKHSSTVRTGFWVTGRVLGQLTCTGVNDSDAEVKGWVLRLDHIGHIDVEVRIECDDPLQEVGRSGRVLKIDGNPLLVAAPGAADVGKLAEIEAFIDAVLAAHAAA
jgi:hypothetical protein